MDTVDRKTEEDTNPKCVSERRCAGWVFSIDCTTKDYPALLIWFSGIQSLFSVHGCFWHRHGKQTTTPATHEDFWRAKFEANVECGNKNVRDLETVGWRVMTVWEYGTGVLMAYQEKRQAPPPPYFNAMGKSGTVLGLAVVGVWRPPVSSLTRSDM